MANFETYMKSKRETEQKTYESLRSLQGKLEAGYTRSQQKKEEIRLSAA